MEPQYINNLGNWKPDTQYECYSDKMSIKTMNVMSGASENYKVHYNPRTVPKPPEELQILIFSFIERCNISLNALDASDPRPKYFAFLDFMERGRTILLQDVAQMMNIGRTHILIDREFFKTELFLKFRETLGIFCNTSVNPVSQSLKDVHPELSSKLTNLHSDVNGHQKNSMGYLSSNFRQINDNVVTLKNDVARTTTVSDMQFFSSIAQVLKKVLIYPNR